MDRHDANDRVSKPPSRWPQTRTIAMLGSMPPLRALSSYCLELASVIAELGNVEFISFSKIYPTHLYPGGGLKDDHSFPELNHQNLRVKRRITWYNPVSWILEGLSTKADLLHAQWWSLPLSPVYFAVCLGFKIRRKPIIFTVHNVLSHEKFKIYSVISRLLFKLGDHFIVHSAPNKDQLIRYYHVKEEEVTQIPHGPLDFHVRQGIDRDKVRREMGLSRENKVILLFGAIRPYKGIATALFAFRDVINKISEARLIIAGKLWESWDPYDKIINDLDLGDYINTYLRYIPSGEVFRFFEASDLVVLPYHHFDSQSGVGAAAISFSKPLIVTNLGGLAELVIKERYAIPPKDPVALAELIVDCFQTSDRLVQMADDSRTVAESMAWSSIAKKTWSIYDNMLGYVERHTE